LLVYESTNHDKNEFIIIILTSGILLNMDVLHLKILYQIALDKKSSHHAT